MGSLSQQSAELQAIAALCQGAIELWKNFLCGGLECNTATTPRWIETKTTHAPISWVNTRDTREIFTTSHKLQVKSAVFFFFLIYICKSDWTMCISETIHKLKVSLSILTSPMEYDNKNKTNKNFGRKFLYGRSRNLQRGTKALYKHLQQQKL